MFRRTLLSTFALSVAAATGAWVSPSLVSPSVVKWPPWISIESPVNPYDHVGTRRRDARPRGVSRRTGPTLRPERQRRRHRRRRATQHSASL